MTLAAQAQPKLDRAIDDSIMGSGPFAAFLETQKQEILAKKKQENDRLANSGLALSSDALNQAAEDEMKSYARTTFKGWIESALKGEKKTDLKELAGMGMAAGQAVSQFGAGGWGVISAIQTVMANFGDYISAAWKVISGNSNADQSKGFFAKLSEELQDIRAEKTLAALAQNTGTTVEKIKDSLLTPEVQMQAMDNTFKQSITTTDDQIKDQVKALIINGEIRMDDKGAFATQKAINELDALSSTPANTPHATAPLAGRQGKSWAANT